MDSENIFIGSKIKKYIILFAILVGLVLVFDKLIMPWYVGESEVRVINVVGMPYEQAEVVLNNAKFEPQNGGTRFDSKYPPGTVILQKPEPNTIVKEGRRIYLIVSGGEQLIEVPNLRYKSLRDANLNLIRLGLNLGEVSEDTSADIPAGVVMSQSIYAGTKVSKGTIIDLVLSAGRPLGEIEIPDVVGKSFGEARSILESNGLKVGKVNYQYSIDLLPNTVIHQFPRAGEKIKEKSTIDLFVVKERISEREIIEN